MALSQKHRSALYTHFIAGLGDEVTEAFLAEFPAREGDELVTRSHQRAEFAEMRKEMAEFQAAMRADMAEFQVEMRREMAEFQAEVRADMAAFKAEMHADIAALRGEVHTELAVVRTDMVTLAAATNRRLTAVILGATGLLITAGGVMTTVAVAALR